ncbi:MAG: DUF4398 domain-containing protein [Gammaproteobacteria bacterium]|nr:DUF4398 domain-containing protein [Gammaproteobacteria bacterium]
MFPSRIPHLSLVLTLAALLVVSGCQTAPVQEMSDARQAISVAREAGAAQNAADDFNAAVNYLQSAERYLNEQQYSNARRDALQAKLKALDALRRTEASSEVNP